jgi:hypothetical protein
VLLVGDTRCNDTDTWAWNGGGWTRLRPSPIPPAGYEPGLALDQAARQVVYFDDGPTWTWDGATWTESSGMLPLRFGAEVASDPVSGHPVLFGGGHNEACGYEFYCYPSYAETWDWDGGQWIQQHPHTSPPGRYLEGLAAGPGGTVVMFGGRADMCIVGECDELFDDTWTYDGSNWSLRDPLHAPPPGYGVAMAYDEARGVDVLFGGSGGAGTWTWDGQDWTEVHPVTSPPAMVDAAMAYDPVHQQVVLYGGAGNDDTWTWDGTNWTRHRAP